MPADALVALAGGLLEDTSEVRLAGPGAGPRAVVAAHGLGDVLGDGFDGESAGGLTMLGAAHAVGDHHDEREPLLAGDVVHRLGEAAELDVHATVQGGNEEVVLVRLAHLALVRQPEDINLVVEGLPHRFLVGRGGRGRGFMVDAGHGPSSLFHLTPVPAGG